MTCITQTPRCWTTTGSGRPWRTKPSSSNFSYDSSKPFPPNLTTTARLSPGGSNSRAQDQGSPLPSLDATPPFQPDAVPPRRSHGAAPPRHPPPPTVTKTPAANTMPPDPRFSFFLSIPLPRSPFLLISLLCSEFRCFTQTPLRLRLRVLVTPSASLVVIGGSDGVACLTKHSFLLHDVSFASDNFALNLLIHRPKASGIFKL